MATSRTRVAFLVGLMALAAVADPARAETGGQLTGCLAAAADNSVFWPTTLFPAGGRQLVAVFHLGEGEKSEKLTARWTAIDTGGVLPAGKELSRLELELRGARSGRFTYSQEAPLAFGKYRLAVDADGKPWKSIDLEVFADLSPVPIKSPDDLLPLKEGQTWEYDSVLETPAADASAEPKREQSRLAMKVAAKEDAGWRVDISVDGQPKGQVWWALSDEGLTLTQVKEGDAVRKIEPARLLMPLPKKSPMAWTWQSKDGSAKMEGRLWGPSTVTLRGMEPAKGYHLACEQAVQAGTESVAQLFLPGYGLVAEIRITADKTGKRVNRQLISPAGPASYKVVAKSDMKGRMGRLVVGFPKDSKVGTQVEVFADADLKQKAENAYGAKAFDLLPGKYWVSISGQVIPLEVQSRSETVVATGALKIELSGSTQVEVFADKECKKKLANSYGSAEVGLPIGTYYVRISGKAEPIQIEEGKVTEF